jgi:naphthalene 1,2-dioxygenase system ferredoxin subunit
MGVQKIRVGHLDDLPQRRGTLVHAGGKEIAVWQVDGMIYAISAVCCHQHVATLHEGIRNGATVACPLHGWTYTLNDGKALVGNGTLPTFPVFVERGIVFIEVDDGR